METHYHRVLLKLSGEILSGGGTHSIAPAVLHYFAQEIKTVTDMNVQLGIVIGGGNIFRGANSENHIDRVTGDYMGMMATMINALAIRDKLTRTGIACQVMTPFDIPQVGSVFSQETAIRALENGITLIFAGGTGNPFFTTDTAAALRAAEIKADILVKGTKVDGIYSDDPVKNPKAIRYDVLSYDQVIKENLRVMDTSAIAICRDNKIPLAVLNFKETGHLAGFLEGKEIGTKVGDN